MHKKALAVAVAAALTTPMAAQAINVDWYGQVSRGIVFVDDGVSSDVNFVDATASSTRMGWEGTGDLGNGVTVGGHVAFELISNGADSQGVNAVDTENSGDESFGLRYADISFEGNWGAVSLGHGSEASEDATYSQYNSAWLGTEVSHEWGITPFVASIPGGNVRLSQTAYSFSSSFDAGRSDRIRYDTPSFGPVNLAVSAGTNSHYALGAFLETELGGGELLAGLGFTHDAGEAGPTDGPSDETIGGSVAYLFSQGTFIEGMYAEKDVGATGAPDADTWFISVGHNWGNNAVAIDYMEGEDLTPGCTGERIGLGFNHNIPGPRVDLYAGYHHYSADCDAGGFAFLEDENELTAGTLAGASLEDIDAFHMGARVKFD